MKMRNKKKLSWKERIKKQMIAIVTCYLEWMDEEWIQKFLRN